MNESLSDTQAFKLKGRLYTLTVLQLLKPDYRLFEEQLSQVISKAPKLFDNTPVVLDFSRLPDADIDLDMLCQKLRFHSLFPVAIQAAPAETCAQARKYGLAVFHGSNTAQEKEKSFEISQHPEPVVNSGKLYTSPVRSGQQIVSKGGDLIITSSVSHGAELLADGHIHIYGTLRGRALAGMSGNSLARIFCQSLEAELLSIAGFYRLSDAIPPSSGPCQIYLQNGHIVIESV